MPSRSSLDLLHEWLARQLPKGSWLWVEGTAARLSSGATARELSIAVSRVTRKLGKDNLRLTAEDLRAAWDARPGWRPLGWSVDQAARILFFVSAPGAPGEHKKWLDDLCVTAEVGELVALYRGLPLYPNQEQYLSRAMDGARTNMKAVFEAVAHNNPYPAERFPGNAWNHLVLKALFIASPLHPIYGLDERANALLARMLCDYAHERWAAGRDVSPELWRCVGPHADDDAVADLEKVLTRGQPRERYAAALALSASANPNARALLNTHPDLAREISTGHVSWEALAEQRG